MLLNSTFVIGIVIMCLVNSIFVIAIVIVYSIDSKFVKIKIKNLKIVEKMKFKWLIYNGDCNSVFRYRKNMLDRRFGMRLV